VFGPKHCLPLLLPFAHRIPQAWKNLGWNLLGIVVIVVWTAGVTLPMFWLLNKLGLLRVHDEHIEDGLDKVEHGEWAYV
jgi:ammonia channel protein AmtB